MQRIIPFKKEIIFKNTIEEILSMSMDNHLEIEELEVKGNFIVSGEYESIAGKEPFNFDIPYLGYIDENYDTKEARVDIDDFYYEVSEPNKLSIFIDISVDNLTEKPLIKLENVEEIKSLDREYDDNLLEKDEYVGEVEKYQEDIEEIVEREENMNEVEKREEIVSEVIEKIVEEKIVEDISATMFNNSSGEEYKTYKVYIAREGDTLESILEKYEISYDQLSKYNIINEITIGDKLIIPYEKNK